MKVTVDDVISVWHSENMKLLYYRLEDYTWASMHVCVIKDFHTIIRVRHNQ